MAILPIRTERLVLRVMRPGDAAVFAAYRDDPDLARFQDWPLPFTLADAERLLASQGHLDDLDPYGWTQVAIEFEGKVVGDLAVGLETSEREAALRYTISPPAQHRGLATEAVGAMIDAVFERTEIRRIRAAADDANPASMRVIEPLGFRFGGTARLSEPIRGEWVDGVRFALLRDDRRAWVSRVRTPPHRVELVELVHETARPYAELETHRFQEEFVSPMPVTFRHALLPEEVDGARVVPWFRGIAADGIPVGFVMIAIATDTFPGSPEPFYRGLGFTPTGGMIDDEIEAVLAI